MKRISRENIFKNLTDIYLLLQIKVFCKYISINIKDFLKIKSEPLIINTNFYDKYQHINQKK
jgi:hypothetical protein